jgi:hypothetical protein
MFLYLFPDEMRDVLSALLPSAGISHRLFLINREVLEPAGSEGAASEKFVVLGATGNVYDVVISKNPKCSCPDAAKGNICKHRFFVMLRVLKLDQHDPIVWQQALLSSEVCSTFTLSIHPLVHWYLAIIQ